MEPLTDEELQELMAGAPEAPPYTEAERDAMAEALGGNHFAAVPPAGEDDTSEAAGPGMFTILTGELDPTATYKVRGWCWVSAGTGWVDAPDGSLIPALGKLTVKLQKGLRPGSKAETDTYAVMELPPERFGTRLFALLNLTDPDQPDVYRVTIGAVTLCTCKAALCKVSSDAGHGCKHRDAVEAADKAGAFDRSDLEAPEPPDPRGPWVIRRTGPLPEARRFHPLPALPAVFADAGTRQRPGEPF